MEEDYVERGLRMAAQHGYSQHDARQQRMNPAPFPDTAIEKVDDQREPRQMEDHVHMDPVVR